MTKLKILEFIKNTESFISKSQAMLDEDPEMGDELKTLILSTIESFESYIVLCREKYNAEK